MAKQNKIITIATAKHGIGVKKHEVKCSYISKGSVLAIHKTVSEHGIYNKDWTVTHIETGLRIHLQDFTTLKTAKEFTLYMLQNVKPSTWAFITEPDSFSDIKTTMEVYFKTPIKEINPIAPLHEQKLIKNERNKEAKRQYV